MLNLVSHSRAWLVAAVIACVSLSAVAQESEVSAETEQTQEQSEQAPKENFVVREENATPLSERVEDLKKAALELNRDLLILEEDLLFPANTQVAIYVSVDIGRYFTMDAIRLMIDGEMVASHLYTEKQNSALSRGGVQRLYLGNLKTGAHQITAFFHGYGPDGREYKRGASYTLNKDQSPTMLEVRIQDWITRMQPTFKFKEWHL